MTIRIVRESLKIQSSTLVKICLKVCVPVNTQVLPKIYCYYTAVLEESYEHARKSDLCLAIGSSLTVTPAADIPEVYCVHLCLAMEV